MAAIVQNGERTEFLIDPTGFGNVLVEFDSIGQRMASYTHGLGLARQTTEIGDALYYDFDILGSTVGITGVAGDYVNSYSYLPFGEVLAADETTTNPFQFVGAWGVMEHGHDLAYMRNRFYDEQTGTFTTIDPLRVPTENLYTYVVNNPLQLVDPLGLEFKNDIIECIDTAEPRQHRR